MSAPIKTCLFEIQRRFSVSSLHFGRRRVYGQKTLRPGVHANNIQERFIVDPRFNPHTAFIPDDPEQETLGEIARQKKEKLKLKNKQERLNKANKTMKINKLHTDNDLVISANYTNHDERKIIKNNFNEIKNMDIGINQFKSNKERKIKTEEGFTYEKLESDDKRLGRMISRAMTKSGREQYREMILEGRNLILDALQAGAIMKALYFSGTGTLDDFPKHYLKDASVYKVLYRDLKMWSDVVTPQGLLGIFEMPPTGEALSLPEHSLPVTMICDQIRDPGNMGTLIRSAAAVGCQRIITTKGSIDVWNNKVLRGAAGCHFRIPILNGVEWPRIPAILPKDDLNVFIAYSGKPNFDTTSDAAQRIAAEIELLREQELLGDDDNNNFQKNDSAVNLDLAADIEADDSDIESYGEGDVDIDEAYKNPKFLNVYKNAPISDSLYDSVKYSYRNQHVVIIINSETAGISREAKKLAYDNYGEYVRLPMVGEVDSLNCAVAGSVLLYEVEKQFRQAANAKDESLDNKQGQL